MAYATVAEYEQYGDGSIPAEELPAALERASDQIDALTYNRIAAGGIIDLTSFQQLKVIKAVCQQADFYHTYGDYLNFPLSGYSAGSVSLSFKSVEGAGGVQTTEAVSSLLAATGLTSRRLC
ncbi:MULTISPECIES: hypothetical protein [unclassified Paenibacillus]|uniref:hypothetical protein n=1 Tax=unclassified Paenibacillus TaxID=185978 RepID=UPI002406F854|nr:MULTISPECIES: hypothetical protein [unclassified Paenibacillus]MDF9845178.1 hypothetical protein [Paenibacillus sp. PastF-2]MDF9850330.1 hypothetical protein [Paenibacillus sp. PastM-2]MDF9856967.1 hypothetical protein [Paenibacillus sp. PastF-1]MDH6482176.1 hypothetical protein [Paenibacillus sp. PastH-2]MDH6509660.1 hypothetical protein [Paenibacillus sp. PastM-3]